MSRTPKPKDANRTATEAAAAGMAADIEAPTEPYVRRAAGRAPGFDRVMSGANG